MPLDYEQSLYSDKVQLIVGTDEAGRGCLLGPVFAGAVILPKDFTHPLINDSKQLSEKQREEAYKIIVENAITWGVASCSVEEIDEMNILNASRLAM
ncbi:MAG: ribonuclease HII [Bacilli bacterium]|nr:ribonuclease HII [Bacilli bacterium]